MRRYFFIFIIIFSIIFCVVGCSSYESKNGQNIMIGETEYGSISSALASSDVGDTILVYDDVKESSVDEFNDGFEREVLDDNTYVAYEIDKPLTIKGVLKNGERPKVYGAFIIELSDKKFEDCHVTIENLEIVHDYVSLNNAVKNESFSSGVKVVQFQWPD